MRAIYGTDEGRNGLHGSDSYSSSEREIRFFFPDSMLLHGAIDIMKGHIVGVVEPVQTGQAARDYMSRAVNPTLLKGLTQLCKKKPQDPIVSGTSLQTAVTGLEICRFGLLIGYWRTTPTNPTLNHT